MSVPLTRTARSSFAVFESRNCQVLCGRSVLPRVSPKPFRAKLSLRLLAVPHQSNPFSSTSLSPTTNSTYTLLEPCEEKGHNSLFCAICSGSSSYRHLLLQRAQHRGALSVLTWLSVSMDRVPNIEWSHMPHQPFHRYTGRHNPTFLELASRARIAFRTHSESIHGDAGGLPCLTFSLNPGSWLDASVIYSFEAALPRSAGKSRSPSMVLSRCICTYKITSFSYTGTSIFARSGASLVSLDYLSTHGCPFSSSKPQKAP